MTPTKAALEAFDAFLANVEHWGWDEEIETIKQALTANTWQPIETAPRGNCHPYTDELPSAIPSTYVLVFNGIHMGVAYCMCDITDKNYFWYAEDTSEPIEPEPTLWQPLPEQPPC